MTVPGLATIWRGLVLTAIASGSVFFALADMSGIPLAGYDDSLLHFLALAAMSLLAVTAYPRAPLTHLLLAFGLLAGLTELLQFLPGMHREPDWSDFAFDILGIDCALIVVAWLRWLFRQADRGACSSAFALVVGYAPLVVALCVWAGDVGAAIATLLVAMITAIGSSMLAQRHLGFVPLALLLGVGRAK